MSSPLLKLDGGTFPQISLPAELINRVFAPSFFSSELGGSGLLISKYRAILGSGWLEMCETIEILAFLSLEILFPPWNLARLQIPLKFLGRKVASRARKSAL